MPQKLTKTEIVKMILNEDQDIMVEDEDIIHLLLDRKLSKPIYTDKSKLSFGERVADKVAAVAGSWGFIISFVCVLLLWIVLNGMLLANAFDPYPFILLNLVLSCVAALQAPVIMMSQNRQEEKDRQRAENDYRVNLKAEIIIEDLHEKLDRLMLSHEKLLLQLNLVENEKGNAGISVKE